MNRKDIAQQLHNRMPQLTPAQTSQVVNHIVQILAQAATQGQSIHLRGFATISVTQRKATNGYDFQKRTRVHVPPVKMLRIVTSKRLKYGMNHYEQRP